MSIKRKVLLPIIVLGVVSFLAIQLFSYYNFRKRVRAESLRKNSAILNYIIKQKEDTLKSIAIQLSSSSVTIEAYKKNNPMLLKKEFLPLWKKLRKEGIVYEIHFFKPPAVNFFNFSNFSTNLKDVSDVRSDVEWITSSFTSSSHLLICKVFPGIRATYPIIDEKGKLLGGISVGNRLDKIVYDIKRLTNHEAFIVYKNNVLHHLIPKVYKSYIKDKLTVNDLVVGATTTHLSQPVLEGFDFNRKSQFVRLGKIDYLLTFYELRDFNSELIGYAGILNNVVPVRNLFIEQIIASLVLFIVAAFLIYNHLYRYTENILKKVEKIFTVSNNLKEKNFKILEDMKAPEENLESDELDVLKHNVIIMGEELKRFYMELEEIINKKTEELRKLYKDLKAKNKELTHQLYTDYLTDLPNRNAVTRDLEKIGNAVLVIMDIDSFKRVNDFYGVNIGNEILKEFSKKLKSIADMFNYSIYRIAGDEFAFAKECDDDVESIKDEIKKIEKRIDEIVIKLDKYDIEVSLGVTMGVAACDKNLLLEKADMALKYAKSHQLSFVFYDKEHKTEEEFRDYIKWQKILKRVVNQKSVVPYFQPIADNNLNIIKYECLMRIADGDIIYNPSQFLKPAKDLKFYLALSKMMFEKCFDYFKDKSVSFSINVSVYDIVNEEMANFIVEKIENFTDTKRVIVEITESESIENFDETLNFINKIRKAGAKIAIDDFGSGYSNFEYIIKLKPDYLKVDGSLVKTIDTDRDIYLATKTIVKFAKEIQIKTIAEFVYNETIFEIVKDMGVDEFQGYFIGKPTPKI